MTISAPVDIAEIKARIYDAFEQGYDDKEQVYEDLAECYYEGFTEDEANQFGSFEKFLEAVDFDKSAKEMSRRQELELA